jgi:hypothetical protein
MNKKKALESRNNRTNTELREEAYANQTDSTFYAAEKKDYDSAPDN